MPLKVGLILCSFIKITILDCPLGPVTYSTTDEFHFTEQALDAIRGRLVMSLMLMSLLSWAYLVLVRPVTNYGSSKGSQLSETEDCIFP